VIRRSMFWSSVLLLLIAASGCGTAKGESSPEAAPVAALTVVAVAAIERPIVRFIRVTGTLAAEEQADVAAEVQGRVVATPVERGSRVTEGSDLIRIAPAEAAAQAAEAEANAAQLEGRLGLADGAPFDLDRVPEVANARATLTLAQGDYDRAKMLFDKKLLSQAEFDQRSAQAEVTRRQYDIARNGAVQQYQALLGARARVSLARKALADTVVRAPFAGVVGERLVSVGDYVTRGMKVVSVLRTNPLRLQLTVPQQDSLEVGVGRSVSLLVDTAPGKVFTGQVRYVSPALQADSRTLVVEAVVPNPDGSLKPGTFATAQIEQRSPTPGVVVPAAAVRTVAGTARVYVVAGDRVEERLVTMAQTTAQNSGSTGASTGASSEGGTGGNVVEITSGLAAGEQVATTNVAQLTDGARVAVEK
jgi:membrane fusion protein (multidrug efflux system)